MFSAININHNDINYKIYCDGVTVYAPIATLDANIGILSKKHFDELTSGNELMALGYFASFYELNSCNKYYMHQLLQDKDEVKKAEYLARLLINSNWSGPTIDKARLFLDIIKGDLPDWMKEREKTPLEKDNDRFLRKKSRLKLEYMLEHGKKCEFCNKTFEPIKLCLVKKDKQKIGYSFDKVFLICKSCNSKR